MCDANKNSNAGQEMFPGEMSEQEIIEFIANGDAHQGLIEIDGFENKITEVPNKELLDENYHAEYRSWYGTKQKPRFCPQQSKFNGRGGAHKGADIFALKGTSIVALVDGVIQWNPRGSSGKWGNHIFLNYRHSGNNYTFVYAHLDALVGKNNRRVKRGEIICRSGCSGNTTYCGELNACDRNEDHLHLELFGPGGRRDPIASLGWSMKFENEDRCYYTQC